MSSTEMCLSTFQLLRVGCDPPPSAPWVSYTTTSIVSESPIVPSSSSCFESPRVLPMRALLSQQHCSRGVCVSWFGRSPLRDGGMNKSSTSKNNSTSVRVVRNHTFHCEYFCSRFCLLILQGEIICWFNNPLSDSVHLGIFQPFRPEVFS